MWQEFMEKQGLGPWDCKKPGELRKQWREFIKQRGQGQGLPAANSESNDAAENCQKEIREARKKMWREFMKQQRAKPESDDEKVGGKCPGKSGERRKMWQEFMEQHQPASSENEVGKEQKGCRRQLFREFMKQQNAASASEGEETEATSSRKAPTPPSESASRKTMRDFPMPNPSLLKEPVSESSDDEMKTDEGQNLEELARQNPQALWHLQMMQFHRNAMQNFARDGEGPMQKCDQRPRGPETHQRCDQHQGGPQTAPSNPSQQRWSCNPDARGEMEGGPMAWGMGPWAWQRPWFLPGPGQDSGDQTPGAQEPEQKQGTQKPAEQNPSTQKPHAHCRPHSRPHCRPLCGPHRPWLQAMHAAGLSPEQIKAWRRMRLQQMKEMNPQFAEIISQRREMWRKWKQYVQDHMESSEGSSEEETTEMKK
jgi:hypothetical protein